MPGIIHKLDGWKPIDPPSGKSDEEYFSEPMTQQRLNKLRDRLIELKALYNKLLDSYRKTEIEY